jgi:hypothetical protein
VAAVPDWASWLLLQNNSGGAEAAFSLPVNWDNLHSYFD